jgi:hypothetical protein
MVFLPRLTASRRGSSKERASNASSPPEVSKATRRGSQLFAPVDGPRPAHGLGPRRAGNRRQRTAEEPGEAFAAQPASGLYPRQLIKRGRQVHELHDAAMPHGRALIGVDHQQGDAHRLAVELRVVEQAVVQEFLAMVGGDHHGRLASEAEPLQVREKP